MRVQKLGLDVGFVYGNRSKIGSLLGGVCGGPSLLRYMGVSLNWWSYCELLL